MTLRETLTTYLFLGFYASLSVSQQATESKRKPHVVFIVADDLGWNDVSWHNRDIHTPNLERLANEGILLNSSYTSATCSPSRAAILTGYYPYHLGLQHSNIVNGAPTGVQLGKTFLPQKLKALGYSTHMVGKWHLGYCNWNYTPTYRGFDSFYGYYNSGEDYYTHRSMYRYRGQKIGGLDFTFNKELIRDKNGSYSTHVFTDRAIDVILDHETDKPLFLYLPYQAAHGPLQVPEIYSQPYRKKFRKPRATFLGMVTALDEAVGKVVEALKETDMWNNTLLVFTTDNGGMPNGGGNNYPLRGGKFTIWEGGVRGVGFIHGRMLNEAPYVYDGLFHAVDWFPTLLTAVHGGSSSKVEAAEHVDGIDHWQSLTGRLPSPRDEFVYNIDQVYGYGAIRVGDYKLIVGDTGNRRGDYNGWYKPDQKSPTQKRNRKKVMQKIAHPMFMLNGKKGRRGGGKNRKNRDRKNKKDKKRRRGPKSRRQPSIAEFHERSQFKRRSKRSVESVQAGSQMRLFNIRDDPEERMDLSTVMPVVLDRLHRAYQRYEESAAPVKKQSTSPLADPRKWGDAFVPGWC